MAILDDTTHPAAVMLGFEEAVLFLDPRKLLSRKSLIGFWCTTGHMLSERITVAELDRWMPRIAERIARQGAITVEIKTFLREVYEANRLNDPPPPPRKPSPRSTDSSTTPIKPGYTPISPIFQPSGPRPTIRIIAGPATASLTEPPGLRLKSRPIGGSRATRNQNRAAPTITRALSRRATEVDSSRGS